MVFKAEPALVALGDQVQQLIINSGLEAAMFVIVLADGSAEYRSRLTIEEFRLALAKVAEAL